MLTTTVTTKGQVVIPLEIRTKLGIKTGSKVKVTTKGNDIILHIDDVSSQLNNFRDKVRTKLKKKNQVVTDDQINQAKSQVWQNKA